MLRFVAVYLDRTSSADHRFTLCSGPAAGQCATTAYLSVRMRKVATAGSKQAFAIAV